MIDRKALNEKYGRFNDRFDARFSYMMSLQGVRFDQETRYFYLLGVKQPVFGCEFMMHSDDDMFADRIDSLGYNFKG